MTERISDEFRKTHKLIGKSINVIYLYYLENMIMRWTRDEINLLRKVYYILPKEEVMQILFKHSWEAIVSKVHYLKKRGWKFSEDT